MLSDGFHIFILEIGRLELEMRLIPMICFSLKTKSDYSKNDPNIFAFRNVRQVRRNSLTLSVCRLKMMF